MKDILKKISKKKVIVVLLPLIFLIFTMCISITSIIQPETATTGERIDIIINVAVTPAETKSYNLVFGFLAPINWDVPSNAVATYTSPNGSGTMSLAPDDSWSNQIKDANGIGENYGEVKWIVFISDDLISGQNKVAFTGQINLSVDVGNENIKTQLGYVVANTGWGITTANNGKKNYAIDFTSCIEVTGGTNTLIDLCGPRPFPVSITPETFSSKDIVNIMFEAKKGDDRLVGANQIYLCAQAMVNGELTQSCSNSNETAMRNLGNDIWEISIWLPGLLDVAMDSEISDVTYIFKNEIGDIVIQNPDTLEDFQLTPNCN